jgi:hypothetical protein
VFTNFYFYASSSCCTDTFNSITVGSLSTAFFVSHNTSLTKRGHSSPTGFHCANQVYTYYERDEDLDLDSQELFWLLRKASANPLGRKK